MLFLARKPLIIALMSVALPFPGAAQESPCERYNLAGLSLGMTQREVRRLMDARPSIREPVLDGAEAGLREVYGEGPSSIEVRYTLATPGGESPEVRWVGTRVTGVEDSPGAIEEVFLGWYGTPTSGAAALRGGLRTGPATWEIPVCGVQVTAYRRPATWWNPGAGSILVEMKAAPPRSSSSTPPVPAVVAPQNGSPPGPSDLYVGGVGGVTRPVLIPESMVLPEIPKLARQAGGNRTVPLEVVVLSDGSVGEVRVLRPTGSRLGFEESAIAAVRAWRYTPATLDGKPVGAIITVSVAFR